ncbi:MAG: 23S rRNA (uracil(1939)-C(5))-methyltransferase RlmD [Acholeplasmataceae bacterium]|nr:23S rRNA (uracil(1939)-C(5))-methyltransferase RlmD [Acholeplasmataceae bacterium]
MEITCLKLNDLTESVCENNLKVRYMLPLEKATFINRKNKVIHEHDIIEKSMHRTRVICPIFYECGGCDFLHIKYEEQVRMKSEFISKLIERNHIITDLLPMIKNDKPLNYRHKIVASATSINKKLKLGLFQENSKNIIAYLKCHIQDESGNAVLASVEELLSKYKIPAYDIDLNVGIVKHVMIRKSFASNQMLVVIATNGTLLPNGKKIASDLVKKHPLVQTVIQNIHRKKTKLVLLDEEKVIYGKGYIEDKIDDITFRLSSKSFYQVNPVQMIKLYQTALELAQIQPNDIVMDTYSGIGTIALLASKRAKEVIAIESNQSSYQDAMINKKHNQVSNITLIHSDVETYLKSYKGRVDCLIMDPTREGSTDIFLNALLELKPKKIVYISCDPRTQIRDILVLLKGYHLVSVQPVDMFSQTVHVESIALLKLK